RFVGLAAAALAIAGACVNPVLAERVRYHFTPADLCGNTVQTPAGKDNAIGERVSYFGLGNKPYGCPIPPTHMVTFLHPVNRREVTVPLALPEGTPRMVYRSDRIIYNYGSYAVEVIFLPDGSVDTIYDSGMFAPLR